MGMSIVAACLPTLGPLFSETSSKSLSNAFRSFFSLRSISSSKFSLKKNVKLNKDADTASNSSKTHFAARVMSDGEAYKLRDLEAHHELHPADLVAHENRSDTR